VSFYVTANEFVVFSARAGVRKTRLLMIVPGVINKSVGEIFDLHLSPVRGRIPGWYF
jgi:ABC-type transport system involved in cytochrome c biogenesis ATPase subunit